MVATVSSNWKKLQEQLKSDKKPSSSSTSSTTTAQKRARPFDKPHGHNKKPRLSQTASNKVNPLQSKRMGSAFSSTATTNAALLAAHDLTTEDLSAAYGSSTTTTTHSPSASSDEVNGGLHPTHKIGRYLALDCEMVGTGPPPYADNVLARVSLVNFHGEQIYDSFVQPSPGTTVRDYRTHVSGVRASDLRPDYARPYSNVQRDVTRLLKGRVLVGHALKNDLEVLALVHPKRDVRDTSRYAPYRVESRGKPPALRNLAKSVLGLAIQEGAHSSVEDARATMALYRREKAGFERENRKRFGVSRAPAVVEKESDGEDEDDEEEDEEDLDFLDGEEDLEFDDVRPVAASRPAASGGAKKKKGKKKKRTKRA